MLFLSLRRAQNPPQPEWQLTPSLRTPSAPPHTQGTRRVALKGAFHQHVLRWVPTWAMALLVTMLACHLAGFSCKKAKPQAEIESHFIVNYKCHSNRISSIRDAIKCDIIALLLDISFSPSIKCIN